ncbi:hypothetical protein SVA_3885 [Sulfurifustis variabilis]|uniref:Pyridine nucleotide-disulfide oxidoreductase n=1 Tax=Sulfurifustis variabilis TaxID=1675686 RepID=A0A1B4VA12_9GAMM|nr:hypothetical protein [Sulfurifustis variabilis]BAU50419.1 hypothetical protein SVA_3885 [Sulfurifustis variabilis]
MGASSETMMAQGRRRSDGRRALPVVLAVVAVAAALALRIPYRAGDDMGYTLGLAGGIAMLVLLLYPIAKRLRWLQRLLPLKHWFRGHMVLGIAGPVLILLHSRLHFGSINGTVAFAAMAIVALSGLVGRFLYAKIHHGLYGRRATLAEVKTRLGLSGESARSKLRFHPPLERRLVGLEERLLHVYERAPAVWRLMVVAVLVRLHYRHAKRELRSALRLQGARRGWDRRTLRRAYRHGKGLIAAYLGAIADVAQFGAYERLFSLWHVLHVPLMVILLFSGVVHVVAVHMY